MNYSPKGMYVWDAWYMPLGDQIHMYHLQKSRTGPDDPKGPQAWLGHAVTSNLIDWEECSHAFGPDPDNCHDDIRPYTGCTVWYEGKGYLFYTMRGSIDDGKEQAIGLALSDDGYHWKRYSGNPVIIPDKEWYASVGNPIPELRDCRDLVVLADPDDKGWYGYYATRTPGRELPETSVIACVYSTDLIHWKHLPPAFAPDKYAVIEVPDVFELNGKWYMTCLTGEHYGNRGIFSDPNIREGTIYAVADNPQGPFDELRDNVLIGAHSAVPLSCRTVLFKGERYIMYTDRERYDRSDSGASAYGTISTPKLLDTDGDRLFMKYSQLIESHVIAELITPSKLPAIESGTELCVWPYHWRMSSATWVRSDNEIIGNSRTGWGVLSFDESAESFIYEADITIEEGVAAGLAIRFKNHNHGAIVAMDAIEQSVFYGETMGFNFVEKRLSKITVDQPVHLAIINRLEHVEVYLDDELKLAFSRYLGIGGHIGLFVDRAKARFENIRFRVLNVSCR